MGWSKQTGRPKRPWVLLGHAESCNAAIGRLPVAQGQVRGLSAVRIMVVRRKGTQAFRRFELTLDGPALTGP